MNLSASSSSGSFLRVRKRVNSSVDDSYASASFKRPRVSSISGNAAFSRGASVAIGEGDDRLIITKSTYKRNWDFASRSSPRLSRTSSFTSLSLSRATSPDPMFATDTPGHELMRSVSAASLRDPSPIVQQFPDVSAKYHMQLLKTTSIDYARPSPVDALTARLLACSEDNITFFTRGNRIYFKNLNNGVNEEATQLYKLSESRGCLRAIECGGKSLPGVVAVGTSQGFVQTWDIQTRKLILAWPTSKDISALAWNGPVLTVGSVKGTVRLYDTRISPVEKMREQSRKNTRHQSHITSLSWNANGKLLASGDATGMIHCWEAGQTPMMPLNVGEFVQRRKKIQHEGGISAITWSPHSNSLLATGDTKGVLRLWNINPKDAQSNAATPGMVDTGATIKGIHFSSQCREILTTHGEAAPTPDVPEDPHARLPTTAPPTPPKIPMANSLTVHSCQLRHVATMKTASDKPICDSVLNSTGMKVIFTVPDEGKISVYDVWAKRKEIKRQASLTRDTSLYIR